MYEHLCILTSNGLTVGMYLVQVKVHVSRCKPTLRHMCNMFIAFLKVTLNHSFAKENKESTFCLQEVNSVLVFSTWRADTPLRPDSSPVYRPFFTHVWSMCIMHVETSYFRDHGVSAVNRCTVRQCADGGEFCQHVGIVLQFDYRDRQDKHPKGNSVCGSECLKLKAHIPCGNINKPVSCLDCCPDVKQIYELLLKQHSDSEIK
jgi:hypothetical protein